MNILYVSQQDLKFTGGIYSDLINELIHRGHSVTLCCADSKYTKSEMQESPIKKLQIKVPNQFGVNFIKKGLILLRLEGLMRREIKRYLAEDQFDLVLYATPPITFANVVKYCKRVYGCRSYLMLKDIFPQNAVDLKLMSKKGITGLLYRWFRKKEKQLYQYSDKIGCMSEANIQYVLKHNPEIAKEKVELFPNAIKWKYASNDKDCKSFDFSKYGIPKGKVLFVYGGNLGKPQGLSFLVKSIKECAEVEEAYFVIVGKGSESGKVKQALQTARNAVVIDALPKSEYEQLCGQCDVGMVALDYRFTIPNYPSRMLSYFQNGMPIFACTDISSDVKELVTTQAECGRWCASNDTAAFKREVQWFVSHKDELKALGQNGKNYAMEHFNIENTVEKLEK